MNGHVRAECQILMDMNVLSCVLKYLWFLDESYDVLSRYLPLPQFFTPLTVEAPEGALRTPTRACLTRAQLRRWRSVN